MWGIAVQKSRKKVTTVQKRKKKGNNHLKLFQSSASRVHSNKIRSIAGCVCVILLVCVCGAIAWKGLVLWQGVLCPPINTTLCFATSFADHDILCV